MVATTEHAVKVSNSPLTTAQPQLRVTNYCIHTFDIPADQSSNYC